MNPNQLILVLVDGEPQLGRLTACRPAWCRAEVAGADGPVVQRIDKQAVLAVLSVAAPDRATVAARQQAALLRVPAAELELAWQLLAGQPVGTGEVARLVLGSDAAADRDDVLIAAALTDDAFVVQGGQLSRRTAEERDQRRADQARAREIAQEVAPALGALQKLRMGGPADKKLLLAWAPRISAWLTGQQDEAVETLLQRAGQGRAPLPADASQLLVEMGAWDGHDDARLLTAGLLQAPPTWDPAGVAPNACAGLESLDLPLITIDNDAPHEVDDAIFAEETAAGTRVWVAIAHPTRSFGPDDAVDAAACQRGATFYHPRHVVGMLPDGLSCGVASLLVNVQRPALVFSAVVDAAGNLQETAVMERAVQVAQAWSYSQVDAWLTAQSLPTTLALLLGITQRLEARRIRDGAFLLYKPECDVIAPRHQAVQIRDASQSSLARRIITEAMILAGEVAARYGVQHHLALPYRQQPPPLQSPFKPGLYVEPDQVFAVLRCLAPAQTTLQPRPHGVMAVPAYAQVTSPLRRYADLLAHRQLTAHLRGQPGLPAAAMHERLATSEAAAAARRIAQRRADRYFKLVWLASQPPSTLHRAIIVRTHPQGCSGFLARLALEIPLRRRDLRIGDHVDLRATDIRPRDDRVEFDIA